MAGFVSSTSWFDGVPHIRVYLYDGSAIIERVYDGKDWNNGAYWLESTVGSTSWLDQKGQIHIRAYVGNGADGSIKEYCWDKDHWYEGEFALQAGATGQDASVTSWLDKDQIHIRVYVRNSAGQVTEYCWDKDKWYKGSFIQ